MTDRGRRIALLSTLMVGLGLVQVVSGLYQGDFVYALLGAVLGAIGVGFFVAER